MICIWPIKCSFLSVVRYNCHVCCWLSIVIINEILLIFPPLFVFNQDRLSSPKTITKKPTPIRVEAKLSTKKPMATESMHQNENAKNTTKHTEESTDETATLTATMASSMQLREIVVSNTALEQQAHPNEVKGDGEFMLKSQRIENFRKASAFWKDSL